MSYGDTVYGELEQETIFCKRVKDFVLVGQQGALLPMNSTRDKRNFTLDFFYRLELELKTFT